LVWRYSFLLSFLQITCVHPLTLHLISPFAVSMSLDQSLLACNVYYDE
jgi:hypothetical protein